LTPVMEQIKMLERKVGAEDRARLDQYFSGVRQLEQQFERQLTKPDPLLACRPPAKFADNFTTAGEIQQVTARHHALTDLMVMAVACDQTRVFNMSFSSAQSNATKAGYEKPHHTTTH